MRNRAKCRLCADILESFHRHDYVTCKCEEIGIDGGNDYFRAIARDYANFIRLDDEGNEIVVRVVDSLPIDKPNDESPIEPTKPTRQEKIEMLDAMIKNIENLPQHAMTVPINHYDFFSYLTVISSILKE